MKSWSSWSVSLVVATLCALQAGIASAQFTESLGTSRQLTFGTRPAHHADWSSDGKWVAFIREHPSNNQSDIWKIRADGTRETQLTSGYYCDSKPQFSPSGSKIAFQRYNELGSSYSGHKASIWIMDDSGKNQKLLVNYMGSDLGGAQWPMWNSKGDKIAFKYGTDDLKSLWWIQSNGKNMKQLVAGDFAEDSDKVMSWKPTGTGAGRIVAVSMEVANAETLGYDHQRHVALVGDTQVLPGVPGTKVWLTDYLDESVCQKSPDFSPDGKFIAYMDDSNNRGDIWVMNADGSGKVRLTDSAGNGNACYSNPKWSPDGRYIACRSSEGLSSDRGASRKQVMIMTPDGAHKVMAADYTNVLSNDSRFTLEWNKKATQILFEGKDASNVDQVFVLDLDTADSDKDGLLNWQEAVWGSDPANPDTNGDGVKDGKSVERGIDPVAAPI